MAIVKTDVYDVQAPFLLDLRNAKPDINGRNSIGTSQRAAGLLCYTISENVLWMLTGALTNNDWVQVWPSTATGISQSVVVNTNAPAGGNDGDIWFRQQDSTLTVYQRVSGTWTALGVIDTGGNTYTPDPSLPDPPTKSYLNTNYPSAKVGDVVYWEGTTQVVEAKCYAAGEWSWITKNRAQ